MSTKTKAEELAAEPYIPVMDRGPQDTAHTEMMRLLDLTAQQAAELRRLAGVEAERDRLAAEVEALRADAERYRALRDDDWAQDARKPDVVDAAMDAARKGQG